MTQVSTTGTHAELQLGPASVASHSASPLHNGVPADVAVPDEPSSTIDCICGYNDDDGNTVLCEICNTWQHIECYYPTQVVPDVHECCRCHPRTLDTKAASQRQAQLRELQFTEDRRTKRPKSAGHRKKTKDSVQINGWTPGERDNGLDQRSGSPRDQPPNKRAKTSHKPSTSVASINQASTSTNGRRKNGIAAISHSPARSPPELSSSWDYFSLEFLQLQKKLPFQHADSNSMTNIGVTNDLAAWVSDPEELAKVTNGEGPKEVFSRIDGTSEALDDMMPGMRLHAEEEKSYTSPDGLHPVINRLFVTSDIYSGNLVGEIRGQISRREEYARDPANRWQRLRHPEPFVFFAPSLPVVIDAREEGTEMRYIRRSCRPNTKMRIILDKADNYHFCLVSEADLKEGDEITLRWEIDQGIHELLQKLTNNGSLRNQNFQRADEQYICNWVSGVLANFGGCACGGSNSCLLSRFDRRGDQLDNAGGLRIAKGRKGKKGTHASPLSTGRAVNSRASSEAANIKGEAYDDRADSRSTSGESRSKPTSRDNTPGGNTADEGLSAREKRKLEQLERRFETIDHDDTPARKKKRNSAGSTLNTPGVNTSKQLGLGLIDSQNPSPTGILNPKFGKHPSITRVNGGNTRYGNNGGGQVIQARVYVDSSTQTDVGAQNVYNTDLAPPKRRRVSYAQRILARTRDEKPKPTKVLPKSASTTPPLPVAVATHSIATSTSPFSNMLPPPRPSPTTTQPAETVPKNEAAVEEGSGRDLELQDAPPVAGTTSVTTNASTSPEQPVHNDGTAALPPSQSATSSVPASALWPALADGSDPGTQGQPNSSAGSNAEPSATQQREATEAPSTTSTRPHNLHVTLPPVPNFSSPTPTTPSMSATPGSVTGSSMAQSPQPISTNLQGGPLLSPAISSTVAPSPLKKKISFSAYLGRKKAAAKEAAEEAAEPKSLDTLPEGDAKDDDNRDDASVLPQEDSTAVEDADIAPVPAKDAGDQEEEPAAEAEAEAPQPEAAEAKPADGSGDSAADVAGPDDADGAGAAGDNDTAETTS